MIFDDMASERGYPLPLPTTRHPVDSPTAMLPPYRPGSAPDRRPPPSPSAREQPALCERCAHADHPYALLHRHLDEIAGSIHFRMSQMEAHLMTALDNLKAQVDNVESTFTNTVGPALVELASRETGIPETDVQAQADRLSTIASSAASAAQTALQGDPAAPAPADGSTEPTVATSS